MHRTVRPWDSSAEKSEIVPTILLADDEAAIRHYLSTRLQPVNARILEAADGEAALALARAEHPDVVVLDLGMPKRNGLEVCRQLKVDPATQASHVFILTGYPVDEVEPAAGAAGADGVFAEPRETGVLCQRNADLLSD